MSVSRRRFLRATGLGAAAAPFVPLLPSHAGSEPAPSRLVFVHFGHGVALDHWPSPTTNDSLVLSPIVEPLQRFGDRMLILRGLDNAVGQNEVGDVHNIGLGTLLTSEGLAADQGAGGHYLPGGPSIDRAIGDAVTDAAGASGPLHPTLHFGVRSQGFALAAVDRDVPLPPEDDPRTHYQRIFGELALAPDARAEVRARRAQLREFARRRIDDLTATLPVEDRDALLRHHDAIETLEARAAIERPLPPTCTIPELPAEIVSPALPNNDDIPALVDATNDLVAAALACDLTRVATVQWGSSGNDGLRHTWQDIDTDYHSIAHLANGRDAIAHEQLASMNTWYAARVGELADRLDAIQEGDGTLLDHTTIVFLSSFSVVHSMADLPVAILGGGHDGGRTLDFGGASITGLWLALAQHLGVARLTQFGNPQFDQGPLAGL